MFRGLVMKIFIFTMMLFTGSNLLASQYPDAINELVYIKDGKTLEKGLNTTDLSPDELYHLMVYSCVNNNDKALLSVIQNNKKGSSNLNDSQLHDAIFYLLSNDKLDCVMPLAKQVDDLKAYSRFGETILHWAAFYQHHELADYLLENGVDSDLIDGGNKKALTYAIERLDVAMVNKIVSITDLNDKNPYSGVPYAYSILDLISEIKDSSLKHDFLSLVLNDSKSPIEKQYIKDIVTLPACTSDEVSIKICKEALGVQ